MIDFSTLRTVGVNSQQVNLGDPRRGTVFYVFSAVGQASRAERIVCPSFPSCSIDSVPVYFPVRDLLLRYFVSVLRVGVVTVSSPLVLVFGIFSKVPGRSCFAVRQRTWLALVAYCRALFVVVSARFVNAAGRANLALKWFRARFHNRDIVARWGDVKQGEFGGL